MDKTAIQEISRLTTAALAGAGPLNNDSAIVIPDGYKLQSLEHLQPAPDHFKAKFTTTILSEFADYINMHGTAFTGVFIDHQAMMAQAIIDLGNQDLPLWGKHRADIELQKTPAYEMLLKLNNAPLPQQAIIDFAEDWIGNIKFFFDDEKREESFAQTIKTLRRLKINANASNEQNVGNFNNSRSALESIEIKAGQDELPAGFWFEVIPYEGFDSVVFTCQLRAVHDDKNVTLKYRIGQLEMITETIARQFREKLINGIKADLNANIFIGKMAYQ